MGKVSEEFKPLISELFYAAQKIPKLSQLILHGSIARGEEDRRSDVDLLLVFDIGKDPEKTELAQIAQRELGQAFMRAHSERRPQLVITNLRKIDKTFVEKLCREGIIIWGKPLVQSATKLLKPKVLFEYVVGGESSSEKVRFYRALELQKFKRVKNGIIVDEDHAEAIENILRINKITYKKSKVWAT